MTNNPQNFKIVLFKRKDIKVEYQKEYLIITDHESIEHKISDKRRNLWELFDNAQVNDVFVFTYETYRNIEYVADVKTIAEAMKPHLERAVQNLALKVGDQQTEERNRSTALSYAKDMFCTDNIKREELYQVAHDNYIFIKTGTVPDREDDK